MLIGKVGAMCGNAGGGLMADKEREVIVYGAPVPPASPERQPVGRRRGTVQHTCSTGRAQIARLRPWRRLQTS